MPERGELWDRLLRKLGQEWSRLAAVLSGGSSGVLGPRDWRRGRRATLTRRLKRRGSATRHGSSSQLQRRQIPAHWRLPERSRAKVEPPSIRLDADTEPRVKVYVTASAYAAISAEAMRWGVEKETGGWLVGHRAWGWHRERTVAIATVAARVRKAGKVALDEREFTRMDARLQANRDRDGELRGIGDWHTHPAGEGRPSEADLRCQAFDLATIGDHNVSLTSLIVTRTRAPIHGRARRSARGSAPPL